MADSKTKLANIPVGLVAPNPRNARTHTDEQIALIAKSMLDFGWTAPIVVDEDNMILAGHARFQAARSLWDNGQTIPGTATLTVPCVIVTGLTDAQKRAYMLADNKLPQHSGAGWDFNLLREEAEFLLVEDVNLLGLGFTDTEVSLFDGEADDYAPTTFAAPPAPVYAQPVARPVYSPAPAMPVQPAAPPAPAQTFAPTLNPSAQRDQITAADMSKAANRLDKQFDTSGDQDLIHVMCPHCAKEFQIDRP